MRKMPVWADVILIPLVSLLLAASAIRRCHRGHWRRSPRRAETDDFWCAWINLRVGLHALLCDELYLYGFGRFCRLSRETVQHRWRRSGDVGRPWCRARRALHPMAALECCADRLQHWGRIAWGRMGLYSSDFAGKTWITHRDYYDYVQLHCLCLAKLFVGKCYASLRDLWTPQRQVFPRQRIFRHCICCWNRSASNFLRLRLRMSV